MITLNVHVRQDLGEWVVQAILTEDHGPGFQPERSTAVWRAPLTASEWDADALSAVLSALTRWSEVTMEDRSRAR